MESQSALRLQVVRQLRKTGTYQKSRKKTCFEEGSWEVFEVTTIPLVSEDLETNFNFWITWSYSFCTKHNIQNVVSYDEWRLHRFIRASWWALWCWDTSDYPVEFVAFRPGSRCTYRWENANVLTGATPEEWLCLTSVLILAYVYISSIILQLHYMCVYVYVYIYIYVRISTTYNLCREILTSLEKVVGKGIPPKCSYSRWWIMIVYPDIVALIVSCWQM